MWKWIKRMGLACGALMIGTAVTGCSDIKIGVTENRLAPCPSKPNCITSMTDDEDSGVTPLAYAGQRKKARATLIAVLQDMKRCKIVTQKNDYIHATFQSSFFGFVDDAEFYFPENTGVIHVRSAARSGYYDFGVNKRRLEEIRELFNNRMTEDLMQG
ncbi:MAG: DUF1499 domain-containing protein [Thermodesulfobacteriota bacterium]